MEVVTSPSSPEPPAATDSAHSQMNCQAAWGKVMAPRQHGIPQLDGDGDVSICGSDLTMQPPTVPLPLPPPNDRT